MTQVALLKEGPYRLSSVYYKQLSLNANFIRNEDGWMIAQNFTDPEDETQKMSNSVGLADISHIGKLSLKNDRIIERLKNNLNGKVQIEPRLAFRSSDSELFKDALLCVLTHDEAFVLSRMSDSRIISTGLDQGQPNSFHITDLTSYFTGLILIGPKSREVMSKLTEVNLNPDVFPDFAASQLPIFHVRSIVLRQDIHDVLGFQIYFDRGFGEYLWDKITRAGKEFGLAPVGSSALKLLGWEWD